MNAPGKAENKPPEDIPVLEMQQLVEQHLLVRLPGGQGQHWVNKAADEGGGEARHLYGGTGREAVPLRRGGNLGGTRLPRRLAPAQPARRRI